MITITPEMTNGQLRSLAEGLKNAIIEMTSDLETVVNAIEVKKEEHDTEVANLKLRHEQELARLIENYEDMTEFIAEAKELASAIGQFINK